MFRVIFITLFMSTSLISLSYGQAVMAIDLGSEFLKVAIVKPGVPMEIVLNKESKRKTPTLVAMRNGERLFSDPALNTAVKFPKLAFRFLRDLLGKKYDDPLVERYRKWFPYYTILKDEVTGMPVFQHEDSSQYKVEELIAMMIEHAKQNAEAFAENKMKDVVITVPVYFNQAERRALKRAVDLAGLNLLQLMSDNAAVALNYGIFRRSQFTNVTQYFLFYDMGATSTTASVVAYQMVKMNVGGMLETNPQMVVKGVGFDSTLGGLEMTLRLRDHLAAEFTKVKKTKSDVYASDRAMAKLWKEAERLKQILSANSEYTSQVEGLLDEEDFRVRVTREQFEHMCSDLYDRLMKPVADALKFSQVTNGEISEIILMGAGTRMPRVQTTLQAYLKREDLGKSINTDEAAALGAVYQAAHLTVGFRVKKFIVKEAAVFPIVVEFDKHVGLSDNKPSKVIKRVLFGHMNPYPQKKVMTFNKHTADFSFNVLYGDLSHLAPEMQKTFDGGHLYTTKLTGVAEAYAKNKDEGDSKGVKAHFRMDESGLLHLDNVEFVFEKLEPASNDSTKSTWTKIGDALGGLFGGSDQELNKETGGNNTETVSATNDTTDTTKAANQSTDAKADGDKKAEEKPKEKSDEKLKEKTNDTAKANVTQDANATQAEPEKAKVVAIKENISVSTDILDMNDPDIESIRASRKKLADLRAKDDEKLALEKSKNELESFIYEAQDKLTNDGYIACSQEAERDKLSEMIREADDWQYEQTEDTTKEVFIDKLKALRKHFADLDSRVAEYLSRPKTISELRGMILHGLNFTQTVRNLTIADPDIVTAVELSTLEKLVNTTDLWLNKTIAEQDASPLYEAPVLTRDSMLQKGSEIAREIQYLITKIMSYKRKPPPPTVKTDDNSTTSSNTTKKKPKKQTEKADDKKPTEDTGGKGGDATKSKDKDGNMKKTLEDLENIPGVKIIRPADFLKDMNTDDETEKQPVDKENEEPLELPDSSGSPGAAGADTPDKPHTTEENTTTPRSDL